MGYRDRSGQAEKNLKLPIDILQKGGILIVIKARAL